MMRGSTSRDCCIAAPVLVPASTAHGLASIYTNQLQFKHQRLACHHVVGIQLNKAICTTLTCVSFT